eukprot:TRINITY_DN14166_c0_g1_i1.p1 TRINITY_DN14166_c0_g1~~TRINITY_DN14166_c0_g1_i1.p1  ORF type:complete len:276 (+),score=87.22 TRINITY_DN14166_c0_g1_i1:683-1510(+)
MKRVAESVLRTAAQIGSDVACVELIQKHFGKPTPAPVDMPMLVNEFALHDRYYLAKYVLEVMEPWGTALPVHYLHVAKCAPTYEEAEEVLGGMEFSSDVGYALIAGCVKSKDAAHAEAVLERIEREGMEVKPLHYAVLMRCYTSFDDVERLMLETEELKKANIHVAKMYILACGDATQTPRDTYVLKAETMWNKGRVKGWYSNKWLWTIMMRAYCRSNDLKSAEAFSKLMQQFERDNGCRVTTTHSVTYLEAVRKTGGDAGREKLDDGLEMLCLY